MIHFLVNVAVTGIEQSQPLRFADSDVIARQHQFLEDIAIVVAASLMSLFAASHLGRRSSSQRLAKYTWGAVMLVAATIAVACGTSLVTFGVRRSFPIFASVAEPWPRSTWIALTTTLLVLAGTVAYRFARQVNCHGSVVSCACTHIATTMSAAV